MKRLSKTFPPSIAKYNSILVSLHSSSSSPLVSPSSQTASYRSWAPYISAAAGEERTDTRTTMDQISLHNRNTGREAVGQTECKDRVGWVSPTCQVIPRKKVYFWFVSLAGRRYERMEHWGWGGLVVRWQCKRWTCVYFLCGQRLCVLQFYCAETTRGEDASAGALGDTRRQRRRDVCYCSLVFSSLPTIMDNH